MLQLLLLSNAQSLTLVTIDARVHLPVIRPWIFSLEIKSIVNLKIKTVGGKILKKSTLESDFFVDF